MQIPSVGSEMKSRGRPTLDVPVQLVVLVQIGQAQQQLFQHNGNLDLGQGARLHEIRTAPAAAKLHDDPQIGAVQVGAVVLCDVGRVHVGQDHDLAHDVLDLVLCVLDVDDFDGDGAAGAATQAFVDFAEAAAADAFLLCVERRGVDRRLHFGRHGEQRRGCVGVVVCGCVSVRVRSCAALRCAVVQSCSRAVVRARVKARQERA